MCFWTAKVKLTNQVPDCRIFWLWWLWICLWTANTLPSCCHVLWKLPTLDLNLRTQGLKPPSYPVLVKEFSPTETRHIGWSYHCPRLFFESCLLGWFGWRSFQPVTTGISFDTLPKNPPKVLAASCFVLQMGFACWCLWDSSQLATQELSFFSASPACLVTSGLVLLATACRNPGAELGRLAFPVSNRGRLSDSNSEKTRLCKGQKHGTGLEVLGTILKANLK